MAARSTTTRDRLEVILAEARDWVAPPMRIAEAIVALMDTEPSVPSDVRHSQVSRE